MSEHEALSVYVQRLRRARGPGFSQNALARLAGLAPSTVHRLEHGAHSDVLTLRAIAPHLGVSAEDLLIRGGHIDAQGRWLKEGEPEAEPDPLAIIAQQLIRLGYAEDRIGVILEWIRGAAPKTE